jgi:hypothetical protein
MKNFIFTILLSIISFYVYADVDNCAVRYSEHNSDTIVIIATTAASSLSLNENFSEATCISSEEHFIKNSKKNTKSKIRLQKALGLGDFFSDIWDDFTSLFKPVWGYYEENGMRSEGPLLDMLAQRM